ncbi:deoxyribose-phosphate aldolase [Lacrimispora sp.]|uniref:deoxyribose-phosphate aldolase n=1 Tax=Lacrimispora sp. TaxID=2719234 RepID=UPI0039920FAB
MTDLDMLHYVDHTVLKAAASWTEIKTLCEEAVEYQTASVCIPPSYIRRVHEEFPTLTICTVVGFPLGYSVTEAKVLEARNAVLDGASEVDMVINLGDVKNGDYGKVEEEIRQLKQAVGDKILKVIIETCYLTEAEKIAMCRAVTAAKADYIKTSTGFGTAGAVLSDIELFKKNIGPEVKIKAAGGIRTLEDLRAYLEAGCSRVGASAAVKLAAEKES